MRALTPAAVDTLLAWLAAFPEDRHGPVWLEAYEDTYRQRLRRPLADDRGARSPVAAGSRPRAQIVFCIDVRSESFRRHVEAQGPYETYGYAGFFGVAMKHDGVRQRRAFPAVPGPADAASTTSTRPCGRSRSAPLAGLRVGLALADGWPITCSTT